MRIVRHGLLVQVDHV